MDVSPFMLPDKAYYYHTIIDVMIWMVKLGHVDIAVQLSQLVPLYSTEGIYGIIPALHVLLENQAQLFLGP